MKSLSKCKSGFTAIETLLIIVVLTIIGVAGYIVAKHVGKKTPSAVVISTPPTKAGPTFYGGYSFPAMPRSFTYKTKSLNANSAGPEVEYTTTSSLSAVESAIDKVCKNNGYSGGFNTAAGTTIGQSPTDYVSSCNSKTTNWQFDITANTKPNTFTISVISGPIISSHGTPPKQ